jgi:hypothetical protein
MIEIVAIETPSLGDRGYLATDGSVALVIDPQRDFDRVLAAAAERRGMGRRPAVTHRVRGRPPARLAALRAW